MHFAFQPSCFYSSAFNRSNSLIKSNLNFGLIYIPNSKATSLCAYIPPYFPALDIIPIVFDVIFDIQLLSLILLIYIVLLFSNLLRSFYCSFCNFTSSLYSSFSFIAIFLSLSAIFLLAELTSLTYFTLFFFSFYI